MLTQQELAAALPANLKHAATPALVAQVNNIAADPEFAEQVRENFITYTSVLSGGKYKMENYLNAVMYVSYKVMGMSNQEAWAKTFPQKYAALVARGAQAKDIAAYVSMYHSGKLVNAIFEQTIIPAWILNQENYQKAINTQVDLMQNSKSDLVRQQAANSLLTHLAKPKETGPLINIDIKESDGMKELKNMMASLGKAQQQAIASGMRTADVAAQSIIDVEAKVV